jgi:hypothetical protein
MLLRDQPTPPEVQAALERYGRHRRLRGRAWAEAEEQLKLRFYYGGQSVIATPIPQGLLVHAVELTDPDAVHALRQRLRGQGHRTVLSLYPRPWGESDPEVLTPTAVR